MSVILTAPTVFEMTAVSSPSRHYEAAIALGADCRGLNENSPAQEIGEALKQQLITFMKQTNMPNGLKGDRHITNMNREESKLSKHLFSN